MTTLSTLTAESGEGEHANLVGDVVPGAWRAESFQTLAQALAHRNDAIGHHLDGGTGRNQMKEAAKAAKQKGNRKIMAPRTGRSTRSPVD